MDNSHNQSDLSNLFPAHNRVSSSHNRASSGGGGAIKGGALGLAPKKASSSSSSTSNASNSSSSSSSTNSSLPSPSSNGTGHQQNIHTRDASNSLFHGNMNNGNGNGNGNGNVHGNTFWPAAPNDMSMNTLSKLVDDLTKIHKSLAKERDLVVQKVEVVRKLLDGESRAVLEHAQMQDQEQEQQQQEEQHQQQEQQLQEQQLQQQYSEEKQDDDDDDDNDNDGYDDSPKKDPDQDQKLPDSSAPIALPTAMTRAQAIENLHASEIYSLQKELHTAQSLNRTFTLRLQETLRLLASYEHTLSPFLITKLRRFTQTHAEAMDAQRAHYLGLLEVERSANLELRLESDRMRQGLGTALEYARQALDEKNDKVVVTTMVKKTDSESDSALSASESKLVPKTVKTTVGSYRRAVAALIVENKTLASLCGVKGAGQMKFWDEDDGDEEVEDDLNSDEDGAAEPWEINNTNFMEKLHPLLSNEDYDGNANSNGGGGDAGQNAAAVEAEQFAIRLRRGRHPTALNQRQQQQQQQVDVTEASSSSGSSGSSGTGKLQVHIGPPGIDYVPKN